MSQKWRKEADVIVVGYGLAGAISAIEAHDAGAQSIIIEKSKYFGGCSILSGGAVLCADDVDKATKYLIQMSGDRVENSLVATFAQGIVDNEGYLKRLIESNHGKIQIARQNGLDLTYPIEGRDTFYTARIHEVPGFNSNFPWLQRISVAGVNLMKTVMDNVEQRKIEVLFSTSAKSLVIDSNGIITGLISHNTSGEQNIKARRAVILACGGFEQNKWMQMQYLQGKPFFSMAPLTHTGDGILMAQKVGAALWHMWHIHGSYGYKFADFPLAFRTSIGGPRNPKRIMPWIVVDKFGRRYMNEYPLALQDTGHRAMEIFDPDTLGYPRIPSYLIFDEVGRKRGPIAHPATIGDRIYEWSDDNMVEVNRGWIISEENISNLVNKIRTLDSNSCQMEPSELEKTIEVWNEIVKMGKDPLNRPIGTMLRIETPPFYAVPVWPIITNTQGGPVHNEKQQVIDSFNNPIPHLYTAGELGSFFGHLYQLQGNLGECLSSGRIAGRISAKEEPV